MSVAADNYRVITDTLSNLKRILLIDDDPAHRSKRVHLSPLHQSALASSLSEVVHPVIAGSATGNAGAASTATVESVEQDLEQGGGSSDEIHNGHSSPVFLSSSPDIHIELSQEECERSGKQKEGAMMRMEGNGVEDDSVVLTSASVVATDPIARNEEPIVLEEVTIRKRETTPLKELEVSIDTIPLEEPMTSKDTIPLKEPEMRKEALQKESEQKDAALTDHSLSLEERMEQILTTMDHRSPPPTKLAPPSDRRAYLRHRRALLPRSPSLASCSSTSTTAAAPSLSLPRITRRTACACS